MLRNEPAKTWIKPDKAFNSTYPNSQNFLIKGDNLEALKLLKNAYEKKIKMIYIDPPYNTGNNDFVYKDDRKYTPKELSSLCGMSEEECKRMLEYYSKGKNSHSAWLTFMHPRLSLAKNLLRDDGVIFISIDDNEQAHLKILCDEIFGEENFLYSLSVVDKLNGNDNSSGMMETHEYCLIYAKNFQNFQMGVLKIDDEQNKWQEDELGWWKEGGSLKATGENAPRHKRPNLFFPIYINEDNLTFSLQQSDTYSYCLLPITDGMEMSWYWSSEKFKNEKSEVIVKKTKDGYSIYKKQRPSLGDLPSVRGKTTFYSSKYSTSNSSKTIKELFDNQKVFSYSKSKDLILDLICLGNTSGDDIILDFFAGSGTTAQAVMELNAEDNGNRRFILVQLPESIDEKKSKTAYDFVKNELGKAEPKISDITQERIIRASKQTKEKHPEYQGDLGFQVLELEEIPSELAEIRQSDFEKINHLFGEEFREEKLSDLLDIEAILQTFCLYDGIPLDVKLEAVDLGGYMAYKFDRRIYFLSQGFQTKHLQEFLRKLDEEEGFCVSEIVLLAYCFESARHREIAEAISYSNRKSLDLKLLVRG